ncbi:MAG: hypothetical protein SXA11_19770 [Cyanobacteriota bacterium]|nr:hypothetical protein [Cyanobacteriota bacterium]
METLQQQITVLSNKIDSIYLLIEQLDRKVSRYTGDRSGSEASVKENSLEELKEINYSNFNSSIIDPSLEHKDVLIDDSYQAKSDRSVEEFTADIQIQRLTAQLTAAYHRIAALEDQLLSKRVH